MPKKCGLWCGNGFAQQLFPECVAKVTVSLWGSGGWGCVCSTLRNRSQPFATVRPQPFATVRNRPQASTWGLYGRAYGEFCKRAHFWRFHLSPRRKYGQRFVAHLSNMTICSPTMLCDMNMKCWFKMTVTWMRQTPGKYPVKSVFLTRSKGPSRSLPENSGAACDGTAKIRWSCQSWRWRQENWAPWSC